MRFLRNWCSTTFRVGRNSLVSGPHCSFMPLEWAIPVSQAEGLFLLNCARLEGFHRLCTTVLLSQLDLLPLNFVSARPAHFHGLKLSFAPNRVTLSSHQKVHLYVWCISEQQMWSWGSEKWPWRLSVTNLNSFLPYFIQIINIFLLEKTLHNKRLVICGAPKSHSNPSPKRLPLKTRLHACLGKVGSTLKQGFSTQSL